MARILFSSFSNVTWTKEKYLDSFVEGFIRSLKRNGNSVLNIRTNDFVDHPVSSNPTTSINTPLLLHEIKTFNPDLVITLNNSLPCHEVITHTNCPIALYTADGPDFFSHRDMIEKHMDRYSFFRMNDNVYHSLKRSFPSIRDEQFFFFGYATEFRARDIPQDIGISFLGSLPNYSRDLMHYIRRMGSNEIKDAFFEKFDQFRNDVFSKMNITLPGFDNPVPLETLAVFLITAKDRFFTLSALTDLGLHIQGYDTFCYVGKYNYDILRAYNFDLCVTIEQSEILFNRSKISLNLPNARAIDGFSWRVPDVLSSNAVLLAPKKSELLKLMQGYADLPMYESPAEARELAVKLLREDNWRKEIVMASQKMVDDKCRFDSKIKDMQSHFNICLVNDGVMGNVVDLEPQVRLLSGSVNNKIYKRLKQFVPKPFKRYIQSKLITSP